MERISSTTNSKVKKVASLKDSASRKEQELFVAEGVRIVKDAGVSPVELYITENHLDFGEKYEGICPVYLVSEEVFAKMSDTKSPQGVLGVFSYPDLALKKPQGDYVIVLDGVSDPGNVGTVIRTAGACAFKDVYLAGCADPFSPKVVRSSMGGVFRTRISVGEIEDIISLLKGENVEICTLDMGGESIFEAKVDLPVGLVLGSEARGVSSYTRENSDKILALPMKDDTESLNAGVSAGIAMYLIGFKK